MKTFAEWLMLKEDNWQDWSAEQLINNVWDSLGATWGTGKGFPELTNKLLTAAGQIGDPVMAKTVRDTAYALSSLGGLYMHPNPVSSHQVKHLQDVVSQNLKSILNK